MVSFENYLRVLRSRPISRPEALIKGGLVAALGVLAFVGIKGLAEKPSQDLGRAEATLHQEAVHIGKLLLQWGSAHRSELGIDPVGGHNKETAISFMEVTSTDLYKGKVWMDSNKGVLDPSTTSYAKIVDKPLGNSTNTVDVAISRQLWPDGSVVWHGHDYSPTYHYTVNPNGIIHGSLDETPRIVKEAEQLAETAFPPDATSQAIIKS